MSSNLSISQRLHDKLSKLIAEATPGERLPSEPELAKTMGVSRATLREAMRTFETQGLIRRRQGSGTYVMHPSTVIDTGLEVLESIENMAKRYGLQVRMGEANIQQRTPTKEEREIFGLQEEDDVIDISRVILAEGRPVAYLVDVVPKDLLTPDELELGFHGSVLDLFIQRGAPPLASSRCEINAVTAPGHIARALGIQRGAVLMQFVAYLYTKEGQLVDYSFSNFLPGYFRFHVVRRIGS